MENLAWQKVSLTTILLVGIAWPSFFHWWFRLPWYVYPLELCLLDVLSFVVLMVLWNYFSVLRTERSKIGEFIEFKDEDLRNKYAGSFIPLQILYEAYADDRLVFKSDTLNALEAREKYSTNRLLWWHVKFFFCNFIPEMLFHTKVQDTDQVRDHYDRGNDFYESFLGPMMIYTSGIMRKPNDSLEDMQLNKLERVCEKLQLSEKDNLLDIGCGWGSLVNHAVETHNVKGIGVTLAKNQVQWAETSAEEKGVSDGASFLCMDYRDIPRTKFSKISCLEMAEHVGVKNFGGFMSQVYDMLQDDGIFFLQIAGLRRAWQWEDFVWGLFMDKYIFPGADASCPLGFVIAHLEAAGFEVQSSETIGIHYSHTINHWYNNWIKEETKAKMVAKYGQRLYRIWEIFLLGQQS
ncbi:uncharacterized protein LOC135692379 [Rhopilema esculentum]|uniref:uncharacterized protein LOC135692379 n=1 Tax=Rhopilema esculentum TaxID=499914 RepID=UPI0031E007A2|eukprot:gene2169-17758_t